MLLLTANIELAFHAEEYNESGQYMLEFYLKDFEEV